MRGRLLRVAVVWAAVTVAMSAASAAVVDRVTGEVVVDRPAPLSRTEVARRVQQQERAGAGGGVHGSAETTAPRGDGPADTGDDEATTPATHGTLGQVAGDDAGRGNGHEGPPAADAVDETTTVPTTAGPSSPPATVGQPDGAGPDDDTGRVDDRGPTVTTPGGTATPQQPGDDGRTPATARSGDGERSGR